MEYRLTTLDLDVVNILVYEQRKSVDTVQAMMDAIERGLEVSPVPLFPIGESSYALVKFSPSPFDRSGHHRLLSHYFLSRPLPCAIFDDHFDNLFDYVSFRRMNLVDDNLAPSSNKLRNRMAHWQRHCDSNNERLF